MRERDASGLSLPFLAAALAFVGDFPSGSASFGQADRDGLLAAGDFLTGPAAAKRTVLPLVHDFLDLLRCLAAVLSTPALFRHHRLLSGIWPRCLNRRLQAAADRQ